jgi:hypothetical protein
MIRVNVDAAQLAGFATSLRKAGKSSGLVLTRAINHTGRKAVTEMRKVLLVQTGLKSATIRRAVTSSSTPGQFVIRSRGGNIALKYFGARETRKGVSAAPWGARRIYPLTFIKGGRFPNRVALNMGGHVFRRVGSSRLPIEGGKSGLFIPTEMVSGQSATAFYAVVDRDLSGRIAHELYRVMGS